MILSHEDRMVQRPSIATSSTSLQEERDEENCRREAAAAAEAQRKQKKGRQVKLQLISKTSAEKA